eukprot:TCALIF_10631-PA protein Name:"Protein of unknown function" AED:0.03 eAED:0.03 QI:0/0.66/0.5/1/0.66/0.75/4/830/299
MHRNLIHSLFILQILQISGDAQPTHGSIYNHLEVPGHQSSNDPPRPMQIEDLLQSNNNLWPERSTATTSEDEELEDSAANTWKILLKSLRPIESQVYRQTSPMSASEDRMDSSSPSSSSSSSYPTSSWVNDNEDLMAKTTWRPRGTIRPSEDFRTQLRRRNLALSRQFSNEAQRMEKRRSWWRSRKRDFFKNRRYGKKRNQEGRLVFDTLIPVGDEPTAVETAEQLSAAAQAAKKAEIEKLRKAISMWETKLLRFAEKFADNPDVLNENPTWTRLVKVRNSLRGLLVKLQFHSLDQTRM